MRLIDTPASLEYLRLADMPTIDMTIPEEIASSLDFSKVLILPGFCDVHVHLREPGFSYKETIYTGTRACARGGYTDVLSMPNLNPVPDCVSSIQIQRELIDRDAVVRVHPYASITRGERGETLVDMQSLRDLAIAYSDDGKDVRDTSLMRDAMIEARRLGKMIVAHCEDTSIARGYVRECDFATRYSHDAIPPSVEYSQVERDLQLAKDTGVKYHICHVSTKESVDLIRDAKRDGVDVTCETAPHYLTLTTSDLRDEGRFKMNPPLGLPRDRDALIEGVLDGTVDMIATDHAPHSIEEKSRGLRGSAFGIVGIETAFATLYTYLVREGIVDMDTIVRCLSLNPRRRFDLDTRCDYSIWNMDREFVVNPDEFVSLGRATPYEGASMRGVNLLTVKDNEIIYKNIGE